MNETPLELDEDDLEQLADEELDDFCPSCETVVLDSWFDRELCPPPCDVMHYRCRNCGTPLDHCKLNEEI